MIYSNGKELSSAFFRGKAIAYIYYKGKLVWEATSHFYTFSDDYREQFENGYIAKFEDQ